jgi:hypothetical protein
MPCCKKKKKKKKKNVFIILAKVKGIRGITPERKK